MKHIEFGDVTALSIDEMIEVDGGGKISDWTVKALTWLGDNLSKLQTDDYYLYM
ncbi:hypothetical protein [Spirosoma panaciterrae]|uniref:hypothetical protein n=1 Tax=Spirosoma panaciterrae TaxID=496058 RepID=UPI00036EE327|nr:hypothetical protein [Spirosoma panaciterrae]